MLRKNNCFILVLLLPLLQACAALHHIQIGNVDNREGMILKPIEVKVSETGIDLNDAKALSRLMMKRSSAAKADNALSALQYFQMGPHTGAGVYTVDYIKDIQDTLRVQCTNGYITGIMTIRETRKYPVISGEIVKIKAYCAIPKGV